MSAVIGYDLDFYPKQLAAAGEPWEVKLCEQLETGELRPVANGYGYDDFSALRDLIDRLVAAGSPETMIAAVCESYALRLREQMQWPARRPAGSVPATSDRKLRAAEADPREHRVQFVTVALRERLLVVPCACEADSSQPTPAGVRGFVTDQVA